MASYSPKLLEKKYNNWVKAQLAVLFTKDGIEPFVYSEIRQFQLKCLDDICYNYGLINGTLCTKCCTENIIKCPTNRICNVGRGKCSYHRNAATRYNPAGCPNKICDNFKTEIQNAHRFFGPSYKNTDASQWCSNAWEVAKCFLPPDGYTDKTCAAETDFNGIISIIINYKDFQVKIHENLKHKTNIFEQARDIGRNVRHSSKLEVEDTDLQNYFKVLKQLLSDPVYLTTDLHAQNAIQKLIELENDTLVICKDDVRKALDDVATAVQDKMKTGMHEHYDVIKLDMINRKQEALQILEVKTTEGVKTLKDITVQSEKQVEFKTAEGIKQIGEKTAEGKTQVVDKTTDGVKQVEDKTVEGVKEIENKTAHGEAQVEYKTTEGVKQVEDRISEWVIHVEDKFAKGETRVEDKTVDGVKQVENITVEGVKQVEDRIAEGVKQVEDRIAEGVKQVEDRIAEGAIKVENKTAKEVKTVNRFFKGVRQIARTVAERVTQKKKPQQKSTQLSPRDETEKQYINYKNKLRDDLISWYKIDQSTVQLSPLTDQFETPLIGFYIMPDIVKKTYLPGGRIETTRMDSFCQLFLQGPKILDIYVSAVAGFGKTAFSKYLAITWCQAHQKDENYECFKATELQSLSGFEFLFLVFLRNSTTICNVDDMIEQQVLKNLPCSSSMPEDILKDILRKENCLVILDGLDEWNHPDNDCTRLPKNFPHRYARERCCILTTTRPWKLEFSNLKTTVELLKLNENNASQFKLNAMKILTVSLNENDLKTEVHRFEEKIKQHSAEDMESTPLLLLYLICLWVEDIPIGNSTTGIYTGIIQLLLSRTEKVHGKLQYSSDRMNPNNVPECFSTYEHCCKYYMLLENLGKLAFDRLFSDKKESTLVFDDIVAEKYLNEEDLNLSCLSGILSKCKVKKLTSESSKVSFSHKTVQEYFSAIHVSFQSESDAKEILLESCDCIQNILDMSKVFVFISKMNPKLMSTISSDFMPVINNDEKTSNYRTKANVFYNHFKPLRDIQDMYISCHRENQENEDLRLCLQDFFINEKCQQLDYFQHLQHLCRQNKENIKSINIENEGICSLQDMINLLELSDLQNIEKLHYDGGIVEEEMMSLFLNPLKCLTVKSRKWVNNNFVAECCPLSADINKRLVQLQHLECLSIQCFTMSHEVMETLLNFLTSKNSMKEVILYSFKCSDHVTSCGGFNLDLSQHSQLRCLGLYNVHVSQLNINVSLLEECVVGELYNPGVVSSYLSQISAASKLQVFTCVGLKSSSHIDKLLQTLSSLLHVKQVLLARMNLGKRSLTLSPQMINIEHVYLDEITMSCSVLYDLIAVVNKLPHTVTVYVRDCDIKPESEFKNFKTFVKQSDNLVVTIDDIMEDGEYVFEFKTTTNLE